MSRRSVVCIALGCAVWISACSDRQRLAKAPPTAPETGGAVAKPGEPGDASDRMLFQVRLRSEGNSRAVGVMLFEIVGGYFTARVHAAGLEPLQRIPQHIHVNPTCNPGGGVLINLDENLTVPIEGAPVGAAFPLANADGVVNYEARRPLSDLLAAVQTHVPGSNVQTIEDLLSWLDLENRNAHMHVAFGPPFPAVNCGEINRIN
jgi:hypothetical protein